MAKPNYNFEKRQREIAKKKKQDQKRQRKLDKHGAPAVDAETPASEAPGKPE